MLAKKWLVMKENLHVTPPNCHAMEIQVIARKTLSSQWECKAFPNTFKF